MLEGDDVDLGRLPIQTCWPGDAAPADHLGTGGHPRAAEKSRQNLGIYRMQVIGRNRVIMRWLAHRGGALDYRDWQRKHPGKPFPVAVALGADPATILGAVTPVPDTPVGICLRRPAARQPHRARGTASAAICRCPPAPRSCWRDICIRAIRRPEGPFGDHTGYYNEVDSFPVFTIDRITHRRGPDLPQHLHRPAAG